MIYLLCFILLAVSILIAGYRLFRGPTAADRILAVDLLAVIVGAAVIIHSITSGQRVYMDVVVALGVIVFFGTVALAQTIHRDP
jgi:multicomponent Na+:H+ antiporter subunit F